MKMPYDRRDAGNADEEAEARRKQRLHDEFELDDDDIELVIYLRHRLVGLQALVDQLQTELATHRDRHGARLVGYRSDYFEAEWRVVSSNEGE